MAGQMTPEKPTEIHRGHLSLVLILGSLTAFAPLAIDMYLPAFPAIAAHFGTSAGAVQGTLAAYFIGMALGQSVIGPLADRYGRLPPLMIGILAFAAASAGVAYAPSIEWMTVMRFLQAFSGCAGIVISRAMVRDLFDEKQSAQIYSLLMLVMGAAPILAPLLGGFYVAHFDWSYIFLSMSAFALFISAVVWRYLGETLPPQKRVKRNFVSVLRAYLALCGDRPYVAFTLANAFISGSMFAYITGSSFIFIRHFGLEPEEFAFVFGANAFCFIIGAQVNARLLRRFSGRDIMAVAMSVHLIGAVTLLMVSLLAPMAIIPFIATLFVLLTCGGFIGANAVAAAMSRASNNIGAAAALNGVVQFGMAACGGALVGALNNGTAIPMAAVIVGLSIAGTLSRLAAR
ncbi:MAG: multidrug effflux MFS transporter [Parvibaculum sp.]|nr:multidrug effflux MFS transporter [Parvibaculum sp.]